MLSGCMPDRIVVYFKGFTFSLPSALQFEKPKNCYEIMLYNSEKSKNNVENSMDFCYDISCRTEAKITKMDRMRVRL